MVLASKRKLLAQFTIEDNLRDDARLWTLCNVTGIRTLMVSGDEIGRVAATASQLNMTEYYGECKPQQKTGFD